MTLSAAVATPVIGRLGDLYGPRRVLSAVLTTATAGMVIAAGTATQAALLQLPASIGMTAAGMTAGLLDRRIGSRAVLLGGALMTGLGYAFVAVQHEAMWQLYAGGLARGIGLGFAYAAVANLAVAAAPAGETGVATGINTLIRTVGASLGPQISAVVLVAVPGEDGYTTAFAMSVAAMAVVIPLALLVPRRRRRADGARRGAGPRRGDAGYLRTTRRRGAPPGRGRPSR